MIGPANKIIDKVGGFAEAARVCNIHRSTPYLWVKPRDEGGTDGMIPAKHWPKLMKAAATRGHKLQTKDFVW